MDELNSVCSIVKSYASIDTQSGGHIHIGTQALGNKENSWLNFTKLWAVYENIIFRFLYGEYLTARPSLSSYANPLAKDFSRDCKRLKEDKSSLEIIISRLNHKQNQAISFDNINPYDCKVFKPNNTIEFRCPNGTLEPAIWQNNVNFLVNFLLYCQGQLFNEDIVEKRKSLIDSKYLSLKWYDEIFLDQALELCDMLFSNNLDKDVF